MNQSHKNKQSVKYLVEDGYEVLTTDVMTLMKNKYGDFRIVDANGRSWKAERQEVLAREENNDIVVGTGLTRKEYQAVTTMILALHDDVYRLDWELGTTAPSNTCIHAENVKYKDNDYWTNYYIEAPEGQNKRIVLTVVGKN